MFPVVHVQDSASCKWLKDAQFSICLSSCSLPEGLSSMMLITLLKCSPNCAGGAWSSIFCCSWNSPAKFGTTIPWNSFGSNPLPLYTSVQFNWDVNFNLFLRCHFLPAFLISHTEMLMSSRCSYLEPAPFWKAKGSLLTVTSVLN